METGLIRWPLVGTVIVFIIHNISVIIFTRRLQQKLANADYENQSLKACLMKRFKSAGGEPIYPAEEAHKLAAHGKLSGEDLVMAEGKVYKVGWWGRDGSAHDMEEYGD